MSTWKQTERQAKRDSGGRYEEMNRCEDCDKALGEDYCSAGDAPGDGLVLCKACYDKRPN